MSYQREITTLKIINRGSMILNALLAVAVAVGFYALVRMHDGVTVHIPPDLSQGATVQANTIGKQDAWSFALYMFQYLNHWPVDAKQDYLSNIRALAPMLTQRFQAELEKDYHERADRSGIDELAGRRRVAELMPGALYQDDLVRVVQANDAWEVILNLRIVETISDNTIKNTPMRYTLRVVRYAVDNERNPWGLALDGYATPPSRQPEPEKTP